MAMLEYALAAGDDDMRDFVVKSFDWRKSKCDTIGYFPFYIDNPEFTGCEICAVADAIALSLRLSEEGVGDYWDEVDRWTRNMLVRARCCTPIG